MNKWERYAKIILKALIWVSAYALLARLFGFENSLKLVAFAALLVFVDSVLDIFMPTDNEQ